MEAMQAILSRRSIRQFTNQPVSDDLVEQLLRAAMSAPSAGNQQPWQFVVVTDRAILEAIPTIHPHAAMSPMAALGILVCGDLNREVYRAIGRKTAPPPSRTLLVAANAWAWAPFGPGSTPWKSGWPSSGRSSASRGDRADGLDPDRLARETKEPADRYDPARIHRERW